MAQPAPSAQAVVRSPRSPISPAFVTALCYASKIQNSENGGDKFCFPEESVALILKLDDPARLRPLVTNGNGLIEGEDYKIGGPSVIVLIDPKKKNRVLSRLTNASGLLFSFDGVMKMLALVHDNPVAVRVRAFLVETLKNDIDMVTKRHNEELRLRAEGEQARALVKKTTKELFNPLVEMGGKRFATVDLGGEFKRNLVGLKDTATRAAFKQHSGVSHKSYKATLNLTGAALQALHSTMAYNFKAEGKSNEETLRLTTHYMTRAQRSVNCNRVLTPEEQMKSMTAPTAKKRKQNAIAQEQATQRPKSRMARKLPITGTPMVRVEETQYETADEGGNDDGDDGDDGDN